LQVVGVALGVMGFVRTGMGRREMRRGRKWRGNMLSYEYSVSTP
jgi:hypothetical protein